MKGELYSVIKGHPTRNRYMVKTFKHASKMYEFLAHKDNSRFWKPLDSPLKAGEYFSRIEKRDGKNQIVYISTKDLTVF